MERYHWALFVQVQALREQVQQEYSININNKQPLLPWLIRHATWILNCYLVHTDGLLSYRKRWERSYKHAICETGETILYRTPDKKLHKGDLNLRKGVWLGIDDSTAEPYVGTQH